MAQTQGASRMFLLSFDGGIPTGWEEVYTGLNKPMPTEIGALATAGGTMQGGINFSNDIGQVMKGTMAGNDLWRVYAGNTDTNQGYLEFKTAGDGKDPVYLRQYTGNFAKSTNTVTLLDQYGNSDFQSITEKGNRV